MKQFANKGTGSNATRGSTLSALGEATTGAAVQSGEPLLTAPDRSRDGFRLGPIRARDRQGAGIFERVKCSGG